MDNFFVFLRLLSFAVLLLSTLPVGMYFPSSENRGADQLCGYREADLRLCFRISKKAGFLTTRLIILLL